jgi:hypothetical protein
MNEHAKIIATAFALCGFAVATCCGLFADNPAVTVLLRACFSLIVCYAVGSLAALCIMHAVDEHLADYVAKRPVPAVITGANAAQEVVEVSAAPRQNESA